MFLYLIQKPLPRILRKIEVISKFLYNLIRVIIFKNLDLLYMLTIQLNLEHADRFLYHWQEAVHRPPLRHGHWLGQLWLYMLLLLRCLLRLRDLVASMRHRKVDFGLLLGFRVNCRLECAFFLLSIKLYLLWVFVYPLVLSHVHFHGSVTESGVFRQPQGLLVELWLVVKFLN